MLIIDLLPFSLLLLYATDLQTLLVTPLKLSNMNTLHDTRLIMFDIFSCCKIFCVILMCLSIIRHVSQTTYLCIDSLRYFFVNSAIFLCSITAYSYWLRYTLPCETLYESDNQSALLPPIYSTLRVILNMADISREGKLQTLFEVYQHL